MTRLSAMSLRVIELHQQGLRTLEIADILGVDVTTDYVWNVISKARERGQLPPGAARNVNPAHEHREAILSEWADGQSRHCDLARKFGCFPHHISKAIEAARLDGDPRAITRHDRVKLQADAKREALRKSRPPALAPVLGIKIGQIRQYMNTQVTGPPRINYVTLSAGIDRTVDCA